MKPIIITQIFVLLFVFQALAQNDPQIRVPMLGETAPSFEAISTTGTVKYPGDYYNKWRIIFSHPGAFTPVCTSELIELANLQENFKNLKTELIVISTDGVNSNLEWIKSMEAMPYKERKTPKIKFPILSDIGLDISKKYGMQHPVISNTKNIRGVFIIDPDNKIRLIEFYPMSIGRNLEELKRALIALQESDKHSVLTPANWKSGEDYLLAPPANQEDFEKQKEKKKADQYFLDWYMWFKKNK